MAFQPSTKDKSLGMKQSKIWYYLTLAVLLGITILSLLPPKSGVEIQSNDKINHFVAYAVLSFCSLTSAQGKRFWRILLLCIAYGIFMEFAQGFVPGREQSMLDALANTLGVGIGWLMFRLINRSKSTV